MQQLLKATQQLEYCLLLKVPEFKNQNEKITYINTFQVINLLANFVLKSYCPAVLISE